MSAAIKVDVVNAFVDDGHGGNPAGVVLGAERLSQQQKQAVAARVGLSETAFVSPSSSARFKLEFFTPTRQIAHCGHATVATFAYLNQAGHVGAGKTSKETIDGRREIWIEDGMAFMEQRAPRYTELTPGQIRDTLAALKLSAQHLIPGQVPVVVNTGNSFLLVPLKNADAVRAAQAQHERITAISEDLDLIGLYLFSLDTEISGRDAGTRMFAPRYGIEEEAATGMAAGPLASMLHDRFGTRSESLMIEQGHWMAPASPSIIQVQLHMRDGQIEKLMAGGRARHMETRTVSL